MLPTPEDFEQQYGPQPKESLAILAAVRDLPARESVLKCIGYIDKALEKLFPPGETRQGIPDGLLPNIQVLRQIQSHFAYNPRATFADPGVPTLPLPGAAQRAVAAGCEPRPSAGLTPQDQFVAASVLLHAMLIELGRKSQAR